MFDYRIETYAAAAKAIGNPGANGEQPQDGWFQARAAPVPTRSPGSIGAVGRAESELRYQRAEGALA